MEFEMSAIIKGMCFHLFYCVVMKHEKSLFFFVWVRRHESKRAILGIEYASADYLYNKALVFYYFGRKLTLFSKPKERIEWT